MKLVVKQKCESTDLIVEEAERLLKEGQRLQDLLKPRLEAMQRITAEDLHERMK